jgi:hypothetical protein
MTIAELIDGYFRTAGQNETTLVSTVDDPPKHRLGVTKDALGTSGGRGLGCLSFNVVSGPSEDEHVLVQGKRTDDGGGEFYIGLKEPNSPSKDEAMKDVLIVTNERGFEFKLPISAPNLGADGGDYQHVMKHPNGIIWLSIQGDGNFVAYKNRVKHDYSTGEAYWASNTVVN